MSLQFTAEVTIVEGQAVLRVGNSLNIPLAPHQLLSLCFDVKQAPTDDTCEVINAYGYRCTKPKGHPPKHRFIGMSLTKRTQPAAAPAGLPVAEVKKKSAATTKRQLSWQRRRTRKGLCLYCDKSPDEGMKLCAQHRKASADRFRTYYAKRKEST